jgi:hypothetical protein
VAEKKPNARQLRQLLMFELKMPENDGENISGKERVHGKKLRVISNPDCRWDL